MYCFRELARIRNTSLSILYFVFFRSTSVLVILKRKRSIHSSFSIWSILKLYSSIYFFEIFGSFAGIDEIRELIVMEWFINENYKLHLIILKSPQITRRFFLYLHKRYLCQKVYLSTVDIRTGYNVIRNLLYLPKFHSHYLG